jgi:valyl-tRNA synthetase
MGHALVNTLQDILIRWKRMSGFEALWVPGTDHAGIATQTVVEQHLMRSENKRRKDYPREEFLQHVWDWKAKSEGRIISQIQRLGCSCDWSRQRFTMDAGNNQAVRSVFKKMYDDGLIYRGDYLVNWDPVTQTALADDEVEYEDRDGFMWHIRYPLADGSGHVVIATTRPETLLGDTAMAVNPSDPRYATLIGKSISLPLCAREIPIIADHHVDPEFGTGCVKITPAHDPNDYQIGQRHALPFLNIMTPDGKVNENGGVYAGISMAEARERVVADLEAQDLLEKVEKHVNRVGISYRSKATIEPYMSKQWFVRLSQFKDSLKQAVVNGEVKLLPKVWESTYFHWIDNLRDWCISRQLWWGHRIPIWYHIDDPARTICYDGEGMPPEAVAEPEKWRQDEDVLDTWFSSALWPFATLGWPEKTAELEKFYPNAVLVTGHDILFFWVARMIVMGKYIMGQAPFPETFLHGLIYGKSYWREKQEGGIAYCTEEERLSYDLGQPTPKDVLSKWEKMSKSKGNVINPLELIEQYGTDATRMALTASCTQARQIDLDRRRFEEFKNFANKIWNGTRFVMMNLEGNPDSGTSALSAEAFSRGLDEGLLRLEDRWILSVLNRTVRDVNDMLGKYSFDHAALTAYDFFWKEFCAYYVEIAKPVLFGKAGSAAERENKQKLLVIVLAAAVRLLHPMAPFITEELFSLLQERLKGIQAVQGADAYTAESITALQSEHCMLAPYPGMLAEADIRTDVEEQFHLVSQVVYAIRNIRGEMKIPPGTRTKVFVIGDPEDSKVQTVTANEAVIHALVKTDAFERLDTEPQNGFFSTAVVESMQIVIPLPEELQAQEKARLNKELEKVTKAVEKSGKQLSNQAFRERAPTELIQKQEAALAQSQQELKEIERKLALLS